jgi:acyl-CoA synthetase (AMP-forming)/AMP-acid ligase II
MSREPRIAGLPATYRPTLISTGVRSSARRTPDKIALAQGARQFSYTTLIERFNRVATATIHDLGLKKGDHAALFAPNCLEFIEIVAGLSDAGVAPAMVPPSVTPPEVAHICNDSGAKVLFVHESVEAVARAAQLETVERIVVIGKDYDDWIAAAKPQTPALPIDEWDVFCIPYTSGTTGKPKGCLLSHRSRTLAFYTMGVEFGCYGPDDRALALAPLFHGAGFAFAMAPIFFGGFCEILPKYDPEIVLRKISDMHLSNTFFVPTHFHRMFALDKKTLDKHRPTTLKAIISNAAPLLQATKEKIVDYFGEGLLHETYGSTEGGFVTSLRPQDQLRKQQCVGLPYATVEVSLRDTDGNEVKQGEVGELFCRSPLLFNGYWQNPSATDEAVTDDGWCTVGDLGRHDDEGYLYLVDRKKDMIISGGVNVFPREIEEVLVAHPAVAEASVIGVPDEEWGEAVKAVIVKRSAVTDAELTAHCRASLAKYKIPKTFAYLDALPRNAGGKILKTDLRDRARDGTL